MEEDGERVATAHTHTRFVRRLQATASPDLHIQGRGCLEVILDFVLKVVRTNGTWRMVLNVAEEDFLYPGGSWLRSCSCRRQHDD